MALIKCKECGIQVSNEAESCPHCGAKQTKPLGRLRAMFWLIVIFVIGNAIFGGRSPSRSDPVAKPARSLEEIEREAELKKRENRAYDFAKAIREHARDPSSVDFTTMMATKDASIVCAQYRARNGFGGMVIEQAVLINGNFTTGSTAWLKNCKSSMYDTLHMAK